MIAVRKKYGKKGKKVLQTALQLGTGETVKRLVLKVDQYQAEERACTVAFDNVGVLLLAIESFADPSRSICTSKLKLYYQAR